MEDWSARQYLKFEDERTRPPRDLLAQVPLQKPKRVVDLGCGPGNSTELLVARYPDSDVAGMDSSPDMLKQARERLPKGGVLGVQMPDNPREPALRFQREVGEEGPWADDPEIKAAARDDLPTPEAYYDLLKSTCSHIDIWHTVYNHVMASPEAITEWFKGSSLQPFLSPLGAADREKFLAAYTKKIIGAYKPRYDGKVLLRFPRLFIVAVR